MSRNYAFINKLSQLFVFWLSYTLDVLADDHCNVGTSSGCEKSEVCMNSVSGPKCYPTPEIAPINNFILPFEKGVSVVCTHSSGDGSHSWPNAFYALDLANSYQNPPAMITAAADGKAFVFEGERGAPCPEPSGSPASAKPDTCGNSWGNQIKILHQGGYFSFYTHLEKVLVKTGDLIKQGQIIGLEGWTGAAGHRHLHFSVQKIGGSRPPDWEQNIKWDGIRDPA